MARSVDGGLRLHLQTLKEGSLRLLARNAPKPPERLHLLPLLQREYYATI